MSTKSVTLNSSNPSATIEEKLNNCSIMKKVDCNNVNCDGLKFAYEIVSFIYKLEKENKFANLCEINPPNHSDFSSCLLELAKIEDNGNRKELAAHCKFMSEKITMINTSFDKRVYPEDSFTIACGL